MKLNIFLTILAAGCMLVLSCKKDNYEAPTSLLSGKLVYKGETFGVEKDQVPFQLYQFGFGKVGPIGQSFSQDGTYSALLFDGDYKLIIPNGQGPFLWKKTAAGNPDTTVITMRGNQTLDLEVTPYYMIRTPQITAAAGKVNAVFKVEKIITDAANARNIESVGLYINRTQFASSGTNIAAATTAGAAIADPNNIALSVTIPALTPTQNYVYARIGVKIANVEDRIYSPVTKVSF
ncbi:MAG: DUF3823 domain-containing protein [Williamsia sp.]|nr:DUF3823 domain-containing protein [Williamsia sp.]